MQTKSKTKNDQKLAVRLGRAIAHRRKSLDLIQDDLAGLVDVDVETISRFERGAVLPSLNRLNQIADALKVGLGDLLTESSTHPNDQAHQLVSLMSKMTNEERSLLLGIAELMTKD